MVQAYCSKIIEALARCLLPEIEKFFESEVSQREFDEWKKNQTFQRKRQTKINAERGKLYNGLLHFNGLFSIATLSISYYTIIRIYEYRITRCKYCDDRGAGALADNTP